MEKMVKYFVLNIIVLYVINLLIKITNLLHLLLSKEISIFVSMIGIILIINKIYRKIDKKMSGELFLKIYNRIVKKKKENCIKMEEEFIVYKIEEEELKKKNNVIINKKRKKRKKKNEAV